MVHFAIIEIDDGLTVVELAPGQTPQEAAAIQGGVLADPGPYPSFDEANEALIALQAEEEEDRA